ncbi:alcohol dehydrogenase [Chitinophaga parva]|uniref:Alcohol dehydrogenase n=2 Tax=Chitinophaga parva TaxID=2169414 RepID=A0A2T7BQG0_9BACT|nr:alcohol dehydrogenase [Chitinophaga parva]
MPAMVLTATNSALQYTMVPVPVPGTEQVLVKVIACGVCRTDLHVVDGELPHPALPLIPGHEIVGRVVALGKMVTSLKEGDLVGIPWLAYTCNTCRYCRKGLENLCEHALFTGYTVNGGYAGYTVAYAAYCISLDSGMAVPGTAPLLCAGLIGFRAYMMAGATARRIGLYGFGAAAHILAQVAVRQGKEVYAFTRDGDVTTQAFARELGACWAGDASATPPEKLDAAIIFAPAGELVPKALADTDKGGVVVCGGIHMSDIPSFAYNLLWEERVVRSVANLTRHDGVTFFHLLPGMDVHTTIKTYPLQEANLALQQLRAGEFQGAAVLVME